MPAPKSSSAGSRSPSSTAGSRSSRDSQSATGSAASRSSTGEARHDDPGADTRGGTADGLAGLAEQLITRVIKPLGFLVLTRERIQEILDDAVERGRMTRSDANELAAEFVNRGRQQTDQLLSDVDRLLDRGKQQLGTATKRARRSEPMDRLVRSADRARRTVGVGQSFPILGYDDLTAAQVQQRLEGLSPAELRKVRDYERRHANRKSVLSAIEKSLASG